MGTKPPYDFLGYHLVRVTYSRIANEQLKNVKFLIPDYSYDKDNKVFNLGFQVELEFDKSKCEFEFQAGYLINDKMINCEDDCKNHIPIYAASLFPFIRKDIVNYTNDSREPIILPTLDLRNVDVLKGVTLEKE